jgi:hypothetical protein
MKSFSKHLLAMQQGDLGTSPKGFGFGLENASRLVERITLDLVERELSR